MNDSLLGELLLPLAVAVIMFGLGLSLTLNDFARAIRRPRIVLIALVCQFVVVPLIGIALILTIPLEPAVAVGVMLLVATPGGTLANMYSHMCGADVALNLTLTAITSVISAFTIPLFINVSASYLMGNEPGIGIQAGELPQVMGIVLVPVALGMLTRRLLPRFAERAAKPVKVLSVITLATAVAAAIVSEWEGLSEAFSVVGIVVTVLLAASLAVAYVVPRWFKVPERQAVAVSFEIGLHNTPLAIAIAMSPQILNDAKMAFAPATYSIVAIIGGGVFAYLMSRRLEGLKASQT
jgi:BASS family bile acid:Na+ symporter